MYKKNKKRAAQRRQNTVPQNLFFNPIPRDIPRDSSGKVPHILLMMAVNSSSERMGQMFAEMRKLPLPTRNNLFLTCSPSIPKSVIAASVEEIDAVIKKNIREHADEIKQCIRETAEARAECSTKLQELLDDIMTTPAPDEDYKAACTLCPMTKEEFLAAEREIIWTEFRGRTQFTLTIQVNFTSGPVPTPFPEAAIVRALTEMGLADTEASI